MGILRGDAQYGGYGAGSDARRASAGGPRRPGRCGRGWWQRRKACVAESGPIFSADGQAKAIGSSDGWMVCMRERDHGLPTH